MEYCPPIYDSDLIDRSTAADGKLSELLQYVCKADPIDGDCGVTKECTNCEDIPTLLELVGAEGEDVGGALVALNFLCDECNANLQDSIIHLDEDPDYKIDEQTAYGSICNDRCLSEYHTIAQQFADASSAAAAQGSSLRDTMTIFKAIQDGCHKHKADEVAQGIRELMLAVTGDLKAQVPQLTSSVGFMHAEEEAVVDRAPGARSPVLKMAAIACLVAGVALLAIAAIMPVQEDKQPELL